jgi:putative Holliday junction resolvase
MRVLGVDPGSRRVGLAVSDEDGRLASPHGTIAGGDVGRVAQALAAEAAQLEVQTVVIGLPLRLDGSEGEAARRARQLAGRLAALCSLELVLWDERLTTKAAVRALSEAGVRGKKQRERVDRVAAAFILQSYLDAEREREGHGTQDDER